MGGFALDTGRGRDDLPCEYMPRSPRLALNHKAVRIVARLGWLPDISKEAIRDKSKADAFAKVLVMTQASWLILQCIMRAAHKLPVTALELNTLAHAICALLIYMIWWDKPLDINEPTILSGEWAPGLAAAFTVCSRRNRGSWLGSTEPEIKNMAWIRPSVLRKLPLSYPNGNWESKYMVLVERFYQHRWWDAHDLSTPDGTPYRASPYREPGVDIARFSGVGVTWLKCTRPSVIHLSDLLRWQLFSSFLNEFPEATAELFRNKPPPDFGSNPAVPTVSLDHNAPKKPSKPQKKENPSRILTRIRETSFSALQNLKSTSFHFTLNSEVNGESLVTDSVSSWPSTTFGTSKWRARLTSLGVFGAVALVYGSVHAAAWNDHFPTTAEAVAWKVSCIYVAGYGCIAMVLVTTGVVGWADSKQSLSRADQDPDRPLRPTGNPLPNRREEITDFSTDFIAFIFCIAGFFVILLLVVGGISLVFYFLCRGFLVVEAFIGLRSLPGDVFRTPDWTQYLPHL